MRCLSEWFTNQCTGCYLPVVADKFPASSGQITTLLYYLFIKLLVSLALCKFDSVYMLIGSKVLPLNYFEKSP